VIGELPEKFQIEQKIIRNPFEEKMPILNPNPPSFVPTD
jgi:hypothetical protein